MMQLKLPKWITIWLVISILIVLWDVLFILLRPTSFPNGSLGWVWLPYAKYIKIDTSYADLNNAFVIAQAMMSLFELGLAILAIFLNYLQRNQLAILIAFSSVLLTGTKTMFIFLLEVIGGLPSVGHNNLTDLFLYYVLPNSVWIIVPTLAVITLGRLLISK